MSLWIICMIYPAPYMKSLHGGSSTGAMQSATVLGLFSPLLQGTSAKGRLFSGKEKGYWIFSLNCTQRKLYTNKFRNSEFIFCIRILTIWFKLRLLVSSARMIWQVGQLQRWPLHGDLIEVKVSQNWWHEFTFICKCPSLKKLAAFVVVLLTVFT